MNEPENFNTDAWKYIARAKSFLEGAYVVELHSASCGILITPALHLAGHGLELLLKGCLLQNGYSTIQLLSFGHRINDMWPLAAAEQLRLAARINAAITHQDAISAGDYPAVEVVINPQELFETHLTDLGALHAETMHFPIRYPAEDERIAPRASLLIGSLWRTADDYVKRWSDFKTAPQL
ncbi:hypothetical protein [Rhizobium sp. 18055]|uniref:hypothetical protein n=1 Tax=Rhizobium sp. 18055 TaxID=2681403 RepID=UPI0013590205|nr:hypothetical protein [Rhizobium sp. 18055]